MQEYACKKSAAHKADEEFDLARSRVESRRPRTYIPRSIPANEACSSLKLPGVIDLGSRGSETGFDGARLA